MVRADRGGRGIRLCGVLHAFELMKARPTRAPPEGISRTSRERQECGNMRQGARADAGAVQKLIAAGRERRDGRASVLIERRTRKPPKSSPPDVTKTTKPFLTGSGT